MYQPPHFKQSDLEAVRALIRAHPLGLLISSGPAGLQANSIPFLLDAAPEASDGLGRLRGHLARANPQWRDLEEPREVLVAFQGPDAYVTPNWYATKAETGKVVPTWNYVTAQIRGRARAVQDQDWLARQIRDLTNARESGQAAPWAVEDAPERFIATQLRGIVGIEIEITAIDGKWKVSQNRSEADRDGVEQGLRAIDDPRMADLVREAGGQN